MSAADIRPSEDRARRKRQGDFTFGVILVAVGLLFLGERLHVVPAVDLNRLWPMCLVVIGLAHFLMPRENKSRFGGLTVLLIGVIFLFHTYHVLTLHDSWPLFIVLGGLNLVFRRRS